MKSSRRALLIFATLVLTLSFAVVAEDAPETAYDESASLPYVSIRVVSLAGRESVAEESVISIAVPESVVEALAVRPHTRRLCLRFFRRPSEQMRDSRIEHVHRVSDSLTILDRSLRC